MQNQRACANTPTLSRRSALAGLALAGASATMIASGMSRGNSPVMALFRKHQAYQDWMNDLPLSWSDEDMEPHYQHLLKIEQEMMALPSSSAADFAAKAIVESFDVLTPQEWDSGAIWQEARALTA